MIKNKLEGRPGHIRVDSRSKSEESIMDYLVRTTHSEIHGFNEAQLAILQARDEAALSMAAELDQQSARHSGQTKNAYHFNRTKMKIEKLAERARSSAPFISEYMAQLNYAIEFMEGLGALTDKLALLQANDAKATELQIIVAEYNKKLVRSKLFFVEQQLASDLFLTGKLADYVKKAQMIASNAYSQTEKFLKQYLMCARLLSDLKSHVVSLEEVQQRVESILQDFSIPVVGLDVCSAERLLISFPSQMVSNLFTELDSIYEKVIEAFAQLLPLSKGVFTTEQGLRFAEIIDDITLLGLLPVSIHDLELARGTRTFFDKLEKILKQQEIPRDELQILSQSPTSPLEIKLEGQQKIILNFQKGAKNLAAKTVEDTAKALKNRLALQRIELPAPSGVVVDDIIRASLQLYISTLENCSVRNDDFTIQRHQTLNKQKEKAGECVQGALQTLGPLKGLPELLSRTRLIDLNGEEEQSWVESFEFLSSELQSLVK